MTRIILTTGFSAILALALASCGKSSEPAGSAEAGTAAAPTASASSPARDACALLDDASALFGTPVTAESNSVPGYAISCQWKDQTGRLCGLIIPFGAGWNEAADVNVHYTGIATSMGAFGKTQPLAGVGEEAVVVDGGILGAQAGLRTSTAAANLGAACGGSGAANLEHVEKLTRAVAGKL
jgi:hypothetical protein